MALLGEDDFLALIDRRFPSAHPHLLLGRGDDCAVLRSPGELCLSTDLFIEDRHFRTAYFTPGEIGRKALAVNVSDVAAMGARPVGFSLALMVRPGLDASFWDRFFAGMAGLAERFDLPLAGGDLSASDKAGCAVAVWGEGVRGGEFLKRQRVRPGDVLFAVGPLGMARAGLAALESLGREAALAARPACVRAHLAPEPCVDAGLALAESGLVRSLMDVSDGLARDVPRLIGPDMGADLEIPVEQLHPELTAWCREQGLDPAGEAVLGGEDYALLGAAPPEAVPALVRAVSGLYTIGRARREKGLVVGGKPFSLSGFDHFAKE